MLNFFFLEGTIYEEMRRMSGNMKVLLVVSQDQCMVLFIECGMVQICCGLAGKAACTVTGGVILSEYLTQIYHEIVMTK